MNHETSWLESGGTYDIEKVLTFRFNCKTCDTDEVLITALTIQPDADKYLSNLDLTTLCPKNALMIHD